MLFSSGMAAISGSLMAVLKAGDHAIFPYTVYGGTHEFLVEFAKDWGIEYSLVDATKPEEYEKALRPNTKVVYTESPANPTCRLTDLAAVAAVATKHAAGAGNGFKPWVMCDSTFATPYHQRCLETPGVDVAIHSATKYIGGHSDILAGAVTSTSNEFMHKVAQVQKLMGAPLAPLESFLLARGLRTLHVRMERHGENAMAVAQMLEDHPLIDVVYYPASPPTPTTSSPRRSSPAGATAPRPTKTPTGRASPRRTAGCSPSSSRATRRRRSGERRGYASDSTSSRSRSRSEAPSRSSSTRRR